MSVVPVQRVVSVPTDGAAASIRRLLDDIDPGGDDVSRFAVHVATLDDVFLEATGRRLEGAGSEGPDEGAEHDEAAAKALAP